MNAKKNLLRDPEPEKKIYKPGRCPYCGHGSFKVKIVVKRMLRYCKNEECGAVSDPEHPLLAGADLWKAWQEDWKH